jgi:ring-1,2-phenylacetyl-CoA epoxidase subunit PaaC
MSTVAGTTAEVAAYALRLGDDALVLAQRLSELAARAPEIEEDLALTNIALDLLGQARTLLGRAAELEGRGRTEDDLAYLRSEFEFTNVLLVEHPDHDFAHTVLRQLLFSTYQLSLYQRLQGSADETLAGMAGKAVKEVAYHRDHALQWTLRLGNGTDESHARMCVAVVALWPFTSELFESDPLTRRLADRGVAVDPAVLRPDCHSFISRAMSQATLTVPAGVAQRSGGRRGAHTEPFGRLLTEMQSLHRTYPGVSW